MADLLNYLKSLAEDSSTADLTLIAKATTGASEEILCHSSLLNRSPVFQRMFSSGFSEGASRRAEIKVDAVKHLQLMKHFLYTDESDFDPLWTAHDTIEAWKLFDQFQMPQAALDGLRDKLLSQVQRVSLPDAMELVRRLVHGGVQQSFDTLAVAVMEKVEFGKGLVQWLAWLHTFEKEHAISTARLQETSLQKVKAPGSEPTRQARCLNREFRTGACKADEACKLKSHVQILAVCLASELPPVENLQAFVEERPQTCYQDEDKLPDFEEDSPYGRARGSQDKNFNHRHRKRLFEHLHAKLWRLAHLHEVTAKAAVAEATELRRQLHELSASASSSQKRQRLDEAANGEAQRL